MIVRTKYLLYLFVLFPLFMVAQTNVVTYDFIDIAEKLPDKPWHTHFIDEKAITLDGAYNPAARWCNNFLRLAMADQLEKSSVQQRWENSKFFLNWAIWGYLSPDSDYCGDEKLISMAQVWLDNLFVRVSKPKEGMSAKDRAKWVPNNLGSWYFDDYSLPMLELEARPGLRKKIGEERVARYRKIVVENIERVVTPERYNSLLSRSQGYINIGTQVMPVYIHGWILTGDEKYLQMAMSMVAIQNRDIAQNGMFPYRLKLFGLGERHLEGESMYYHNININALYLVYWATNSELVKDTFKKSVPYYPLFMAPPYHFSSACDLWFKVQWRTFWAHQVAMVAVVAEDGENVTIAESMAKDNISPDRYFLTSGAHAYQQMALKNIAAVPIRDSFIIRDPEMRGLRLRYGNWSSTFTAGSSTLSRMTAMHVRPLEHRGKERSAFDGLHLARPYIEISEKRGKKVVTIKYCTLPPEGADVSFAILDDVAVAATEYSPAIQDWPKTNQKTVPWNMTELWFMTKDGLIGFIQSELLEDMRIKKIAHQFRFIPADQKSGVQISDYTWFCGSLKLKIWKSDFPFSVSERAPIYPLGGKDERTWQLSLVERKENDEPVIKETKSDIFDEMIESDLTEFKKGFKRESLVEISPTNGVSFSAVNISSEKDDLLVLDANYGSDKYIVLYNKGSKDIFYKLPNKSSYACSWNDDKQKLKGLNIPSKGSAVICVKNAL